MAYGRREVELPASLDSDHPEVIGEVDASRDADVEELLCGRSRHQAYLCCAGRPDRAEPSVAHLARIHKRHSIGSAFDRLGNVLTSRRFHDWAFMAQTSPSIPSKSSSPTSIAASTPRSAFRVAQHPSETDEALLTRVLAYCLEYTDGIQFSSQGLSEPDEPPISVRDATGAIRSWIEIGVPNAARLHKASKAAPRVAVYTHKDPARLVRLLEGERIHRRETLEIYAVDRDFLAAWVARLTRRMKFNSPSRTATFTWSSPTRR